MDNQSRCPHCDCPNRFCACVLMERVRGAERREREAIAEAGRYRALFQAAASCIAHNRAKIGKPRGADEKRVLDYLDQYGDGPPALGPFWSGKTDGWVQSEMLTPDLLREPVGNCCACERPVYADELDDDGWMRKATER